MSQLSPSRRRELKARAHALDPVVLIGGAGLSPAVLAEIDRGLKSHELIKVRVPGADRPTREVILGEICRRTGAQAVQHIGKMLVLFRENPELAVRLEVDSSRRPERGARRASPRNSRRGR
jgi:putative YhbY family RNA-binding protein